MENKNIKKVDEVNQSSNPNLKKMDKVVGVVVEQKVYSVNDKESMTYNEYSLVVEVLPGYYAKCLIKLDSKQKKVIENSLGSLSECNWNFIL